MSTSVYVHIPFCASRCDYCAFSTYTDRHHLRSDYTDAVIAHVRSEQQEAADTVYLGGGTPSQLAPHDLARLLGAVERAPDAEVTVEANPEDVSAMWADVAASSGATRISLGVQSLDPVVLRGLGRAGRPAAVAEAARAIGGAGLSYSVDLIYGGAGETDESFMGSLQGVLALEPAPAHVSAYALTVEKGTPLQRDPARHPDDDVQARRYEVADALLEAAGFSWYEISNWARPGADCRHNWVYWRQGDYLAIGAAAHGHQAGRRYWNVTSPERYVAAVRDGRSPVAGEERLDQAERAGEALQLALRTRDGVASSQLPMDDEALAGLVAPTAGGRMVLTLRGRLLANEVACRLVASPPRGEPAG